MLKVGVPRFTRVPQLLVYNLCKVGIIVRSLAESSVFLYENISTLGADWRKIE